jgi:ubiquinone/menaquinone biosynthesis C-methylase UbiE
LGSKFNPDSYLKYRPFYPAATFAGLAEELSARGFSEPLAIADIGCGTGHSAVSLLRAGVRARVTGVDVDPAMLAEARRLKGAEAVEFREGSGERTGLEDASCDAAIVGSAFHWMDAARARDEFARILKPRGLLRVFEYQFPKCAELPEVNEWIRRQFNLHWKAPGQKPRGNLAELTRELERGPFSIRAEGTPPMILELGSDDLTGLLLSQSRVLHYEATLDDVESFRKGVREQLAALMDKPAYAFDFKLAWREFERR